MNFYLYFKIIIMKILKNTIRFFWTILLIPLLFACTSAEEQWGIISQNDSIPAYLSFYEKYPDNIFGDSALLKIEKDIFLHSNESITRRELYDSYEKFVNSYPRINDLIDADNKLDFLKQKADTLEVSGKLVSESHYLSSVSITLMPVSEEGKAGLYFDDGIFANPNTYPDSLGNFTMVFHEAALKDMPFFTLKLSMGYYGGSYIFDEEGLPINIKIDSNTRVIDIGDIKFSMK